MKQVLPFLCLITSILWASGQAPPPPGTTANFGVEGDLRSKYFISLPATGSDDWYYDPVGTGVFVIDTTGARSIVNRYTVDTDFRKIPFFRKMNFPAYYLTNNATLIDALFIRDYHADDSTVFANGSNKNGMNPADWTCPIAQSVPDKDDILDMYIHIRRSGRTSTDPLWMLGGLALENYNGNRYFDFEMYQTDIYYDRATRKFYGYGTDDGHTSWQFDAAGNVTVPGDIIFSAEYGSSTLTAIEARIWIHESMRSIAPAGFDWSGSFDGPSGSQYGYAGIRSKNNVVFYWGTENGIRQWGGPFKIVRANNSVVDNFETRQFMEFAVNLTTLGLDPVTLLGPGSCGLPFSRVLVKSRASTSFTAELKDFVGPFDFFMPPLANAAANVPVFCGSNSISEISVTNPYSTSVYTWSTTDGRILGANQGPTIYVDTPGSYIVTQRLMTGCSIYATDTVLVTFDPNCTVLANNKINFKGVRNGWKVDLNWTVTKNQEINYFTVERSTDGMHFAGVATINRQSATLQNGYYYTADNVNNIGSSYMYYRLKITAVDGSVQYSKVIKVSLSDNGISAVTVLPNPVIDIVHINLFSASERDVQIFIYDVAGRLVKAVNRHLIKGNSIISLDGFQSYSGGLYTVKVLSGKDVFVQKFLISQ